MTEVDLDAAVHLARTYIESGNVERAEQVLRTALATDPDHPGLLTELAHVGIRRQDYTAAATLAQRVVAVVGDDEQAMRIYALALQGLGRLPEATWMAWRTLTAHPNSPLAHLVYAGMLLDDDWAEEALVVTDSGLRLRPDHIDLHLTRAQILTRLYRTKEAIAEYHEVLRLDPDNATATNDLAVRELNRSKPARALRGFLGVGRLDPTLGELARHNIAATITKVLRGTSLLILITSLLMMAGSGPHRHWQPEALSRATGMLTALALAAILTWLQRRIPGRTLRAIAKDKPVLGLRAVLAGVTVIIGLAVGIVGPAAAPLAVLLMYGTALAIFLGRMTGQ